MEAFLRVGALFKLGVYNADRRVGLLTNTILVIAMNL
jgi:hypothetical protein